MRKYRKILRNRKARIERRLNPDKRWSDQPAPMLTASNVHYEMSEKAEAISCGGLGAIHQMVRKIGLADELDRALDLLKVHLPYHESDHVLNICYNALVGGKCLEDIELRRQDATFLKAMGAQRIPDPTTSGDFTRRFERPYQIETLMDCINVSRKVVWSQLKRTPFECALIDVDGSFAPTNGQCKQGMDYSYKGIWGYHPLIVSLANTGEVLTLVNRPASAVSHDGSASRIDDAIELVTPYAKRICVRGDTDFSLTKRFDFWSEVADFVFGMDARKNLVGIAENLPEEAWKRLKRKPKYVVATRKRRRPENVKEEIVKRREFENIRLVNEDVAEVLYRPVKCKKTYRLVIVRKNLSIEKGEATLFPDLRYFFYITSLRDRSAAKVVELANGRCDQENVIEQLKNGVNAMRMPVDNLLSNWAYMVMTALAWNLKAWFAMLMPNPDRSAQLLAKEFRYFLNVIIQIPCQIIRKGRRIIYRVLGYNSWLSDFFSTWERIRRLQPI
jgi:hypothetical protein